MGSRSAPALAEARHARRRPGLPYIRLGIAAGAIAGIIIHVLWT